MIFFLDKYAKKVYMTKFEQYHFTGNFIYQ